MSKSYVKYIVPTPTTSTQSVKKYEKCRDYKKIKRALVGVGFSPDPPGRKMVLCIQLIFYNSPWHVAAIKYT